MDSIMPLSKAINQAVNSTFNAQTLANTPSLLYPEDSPNAEILSANAGYFPGIPLTVRESKDELGILEFPSPTNTVFTMVGYLQQRLDFLTRVTPGRLGDVGEGKRTPASLGLGIQQLGARLTDEITDRIRATLGRLVSRAIVLYHLEDPNFFLRLLGETRGSLIVTVIEKSLDENVALNEIIKVRLTASSALNSRELERQNALAVSQLVFQWYTQVVQLIQLFAGVQDPAIRQMLTMIVAASQNQVKRIVELSDEPDSEELVPDLASLLMQVSQPDATGVPAGTPVEQPEAEAAGGAFG
jgi:hypothetical protein